ncbi:MAG TPA: hypothetical protein DIW47_11955 [Bacteroidetes bacterium]|nr:hypothetical protein [Bacteroidota bacterium]
MPSKSLKTKWNATRKDGYHAGRHWPGLRSTDGFEVDRRWVIFALLIELLALIYTLYSGYERAIYSGNTLYIYGAIGVVFCFILFDFLGASFTHHYVGKYQENKNLAAANNKIINPPKKGWRYYIGAFLIFFSAALKILALVSLGRLMPMYYVLFILLYLAVIYVHLYHTMYWYTEYSLRKGIEAEVLEHRENILKKLKNPLQVDPYEVFPSSHKFMLKDKLELPGQTKFYFGEKQNPKHELNYKGEFEGMHDYELVLNGILLDSDIRSVLNTQHDKIQSQLAAQCVIAQLNQ